MNARTDDSRAQHIVFTARIGHGVAVSVEFRLTERRPEEGNQGYIQGDEGKKLGGTENEGCDRKFSAVNRF